MLGMWATTVSFYFCLLDVCYCVANKYNHVSNANFAPQCVLYAQMIYLRIDCNVFYKLNMIGVTIKKASRFSKSSRSHHYSYMISNC